MKTKLLAVIAVFVVFAATARAGGKHNSGNNGGKHNSGNNGGKHNSGNSNWNCYYKNYYKNYCYKNYYYKNNNHCYKYGAYVPTYYGYGYSPWSIGAYVADPPQTVIVQTAPAPAPAPAPQQRGPCYTAAYYDPRTGAPPLYTVVCP